MQIAQFLNSTLVQTSPLLLCALATLLTSRANILNVAVGQATGSSAIALMGALAASTGMALLFGGVAIGLGADFIVAGLGLNILADGGTLFLLEEVYQDPGGLRPDHFPDLWRVPDGELSFLPVIGGALERQSAIT